MGLYGTLISTDSRSREMGSLSICSWWGEKGKQARRCGFRAGRCTWLALEEHTTPSSLFICSLLPPRSLPSLSQPSSLLPSASPLFTCYPDPRLIMIHPSAHLSSSSSIHLSTHLPFLPSTCPCTDLISHPFIQPSIHPPTHPSFLHPSIYSFTLPSIHPARLPLI